jgi:Rrf2 family protein
MLKISDSASMAIHAMVHIAVASSDKRHSVTEIAANQGVSKSQLSKVMLRLAQVGLLASSRGPHGGFVLGRPADRTVLLEIYEAIDGPLGKSRCLRGDHCRLDDCALSDLFHRVQEEVRQSLTSTRLSDLAPHAPGRGVEELARDEDAWCQDSLVTVQAVSR